MCRQYHELLSRCGWNGAHCTISSVLTTSKLNIIRWRHRRCINKDKDKDTGGVSTTNTTSLSPPSFHTEYHLILSIRGYICIACLLGLKQRLNVQKDDPENTQIMTPRIDRFRRWAHSSNYVNVFDNFPGTMTSMLIRAQSMLSRFKPQRIIRLKSH